MEERVSFSHTPNLVEDKAPFPNMCRLTGWPIWRATLPALHLSNYYYVKRTAPWHVFIFLYCRFPCVVVRWRGWSVSASVPVGLRECVWICTSVGLFGYSISFISCVRSILNFYTLLFTALVKNVLLSLNLVLFCLFQVSKTSRLHVRSGQAVSRTNHWCVMNGQPLRSIGEQCTAKQTVFN
jgi:hypothetical protein